jgi:hypothetical protein
MRIAFLLPMGAALFTLAAADTGRPSPPLLMDRVGAPPLTLAQYKGKVVVMTFILTTCPHCQELTGVLNRLAPKYTPRGVQFLECAFNNDATTTMPEFIQRFQPAFPVGIINESAVRAYLGISILDRRPLYAPHMVFIDRRGMIREDIPGEHPTFYTNSESNISAALDKLLAPATSSAPARP